MQEMVSMVIPCYNKEEHLGEMLQSVCAQTWDNIEVILVNDGSTDNTPQVIQSWLPNFQKRGYKVIVIDQPNGGVGAAVLAGLKRFGGAYFCAVDADDVLYPEYVSTLAGFLEENPDFEWASCHFEAFDGDQEELDRFNKPWSSGKVNNVKLDRPFSLESFLFRNITICVYLYMARSSYVHKCKVAEDFCTEPRTSQEPQLILPLIAGGGRLQAFPTVLYKYRQSSRGIYCFSSYAEAKRFEDGYARLIQATLKKVDVEERRRQKLLAMSEWYHMAALYSRAENYKAGDAEKERLLMLSAELLNRQFAPRISWKNIRDVGFFSMYRALEAQALEEPLPTVGENGEDVRCIGYGALGKKAQALLPKLAGTPLCPTELWDMAATPTSNYMGLRVIRPRWDSLQKNDIFLIFPLNEKLKSELKTLLREKGLCRVYSSLEIERYCAKLYLPWEWSGRAFGEGEA